MVNVTGFDVVVDELSIVINVSDLFVGVLIGG